MVTGISLSDFASITANIIAIIGLPLALFGLKSVARQIQNDRLAVSASTVVSMRDRIDLRLEKLGQARSDADLHLWEQQFAEFMNELEMICAIYLDGQMFGRSGELAKQYLKDLMKLIDTDEYLRAEVISIKSADNASTFQNIEEFRRIVTF